jgi:hypothetical protein
LAIKGKVFFDMFLRVTQDLPDDAPVKLEIDCDHGYKWEGTLGGIRKTVPNSVESPHVCPLIPSAKFIKGDQWTYTSIRMDGEPTMLAVNYCPFCGMKL